MNTKLAKTLSLATVLSATVTNQSLAVVTPAGLVVPRSTPADSQQEKPVGETWAFQDRDGVTANIMVRPATAEDDGSRLKILKHPAIVGYGLVLISTVWEKNGELIGHAKWGEVKSPEYWQDLENRVTVTIEVAARKSKPRVQVAKGSQQRPVSVKHPIPLVIEVDVNSATIGKLRDVGCIIFTVFPSKVSVAGAITAEGLVLLDDMGGNHGLKYLAIMPGGPGVIIPRNPGKFAIKLGETSINPFQQAKVYEKVLKDTLKLMPGGKELASVAKPLQQVMQELGTTRIAGTSPSQTIGSWTDDPGKAAEKTVQSVVIKPIEQVGGAIIDAISGLFD